MIGLARFATAPARFVTARPRFVGARSLALVAALGGAVALAGCAGPTVSFSPEGACVADGQAAGTYPDLEARLPQALTEIAGADGTAGTADGVPPTRVDSGRTCTERGLGTLWARGVRDVRFAGATWDQGGGDGIVSAFFVTADGQPELQASWIEEFYESGARVSTKTENIEVTRPMMAGSTPTYRLDTLNDLSLQTVVVWPAEDGVRVVIVATTVEPNASRQGHEDRVNLAVGQSALEAT